jgi:hypothetical protein
MWAGLMRWVVAGSLSAVVTGLLFLVMTRMSDGSWILEKLIWVFPLTQTELGPDDCPTAPPVTAAVDIEGVVGHYREGVFHPLPNAEITGRNSHDSGVTVEVSEDGIFHFVTGFASGEPTSCPFPPAAAQHLEFRAPGCSERSVPITPAWVPHRVLLKCEPAAS